MSFNFINFWLIFGLFGQFVFFMRFVVQWIASERRGESIIPIYFWYFSIGGAVLTFIYALHINDIAFSLGQGMALIIYGRNLILIRRKKCKAAEEIQNQ